MDFYNFYWGTIKELPPEKVDVIDEITNDTRFKLIVIISISLFGIYVLFNILRSSYQIILLTIYFIFLHICLRCIELYLRDNYFKYIVDFIIK
jgi:hypothetical protein